MRQKSLFHNQWLTIDTYFIMDHNVGYFRTLRRNFIGLRLWSHDFWIASTEGVIHLVEIFFTKDELIRAMDCEGMGHREDSLLRLLLYMDEKFIWEEMITQFMQKDFFSLKMHEWRTIKILSVWIVLFIQKTEVQYTATREKSN